MESYSASILLNVVLNWVLSLACDIETKVLRLKSLVITFCYIASCIAKCEYRAEIYDELLQYFNYVVFYSPVDDNAMSTKLADDKFMMFDEDISVKLPYSISSMLHRMKGQTLFYAYISF